METPHFPTRKVDVCKQEMDQNDADVKQFDGSMVGIEDPCKVIVYCRGCENACPFGGKEADLDFILRESNLRSGN